MIPLILESKKTRHKLGNTDRKLVAAKGGGIGGKAGGGSWRVFSVCSWNVSGDPVSSPHGNRLRDGLRVSYDVGFLKFLSSTS